MPGIVLAPWDAKINKTLFLVLKKIDVLIKIIRLFVRSRMKASTNGYLREEEKVMNSVPTEVVRTVCREHTRAMLNDERGLPREKRKGTYSNQERAGCVEAKCDQGNGNWFHVTGN